MRCPTPRYNGTRGTHPCGGCLICRKNKGRFWVTRLLLEDAYTPGVNWFTTFTYDDDHVPRTIDGGLTLRKKESTQWFRDQQKITPFNYYLVGEYGDKTARPHLHAAVFGLEHPDLKKLLTAWQDVRGHTSAHPIQKGSAEYLAKYAVKKLTSHDDERLTEGQEPEFRTSSRVPALGLCAVEPIARAYETKSGSLVIAERGDVERCVRIDGKKHPLDPYLLSKLRQRLGIPLKHEERLIHGGYYQWHQTPELERNLPLLELEVARHARKSARQQL